MTSNDLSQRARSVFDLLENYYAFACEGGPLKNCMEWWELKAILEAGRQEALKEKETVSGTEAVGFCSVKRAEQAEGEVKQLQEALKEKDATLTELRELNAFLREQASLEGNRADNQWIAQQDVQKQLEQAEAALACQTQILEKLKAQLQDLASVLQRPSA